MIDIHCHLLFGVDDGAADLEESIAMAAIAHADGIRHIFATPHFTQAYFNHRGLVEAKVQELQRALDEAGVEVNVYPGNEVRIEDKNFVYGSTKHDQYCYLGRRHRFVLLEQPWAGYQPDTPELVRWFLDRGVRPVIPHPERHSFFREQPELLARLVDAGAWTQVTADSLIGNNHEDIRRFAAHLVEEGLAHTLATDAHNVRRKPNLSLGYEAVERIAGIGAADEIRERMKLFIEP